ncbi:MAG: NAD(P)-dependent oxidoreductase [Candidatus Methanomethylicaceae archaeon]
MAVLITGGLGSIGSRLASHLREKGYEVIVSDKAILKQDYYVRGDVTRYEELAPIFKNYRIEHVFHFAGEVGRENGEQFPRRCIEINESGTINLAQLCLEYGARLYFASTSEIYGDLGDMKLTEDLADRMVLRPTNVYGWSKLHAEHYLQHFVKNYGLRAISFRFFMCYGAGEYPDPYRSAMANFIYNVLRDEPITVHRGTYRSWCYIDDIVEACRLAMEKAPDNDYQAYNIGRDDLRSMEEIAELICELAGKPTSLINLTEPPKRLLTPVKNASFEKAYKAFGYKSKIPVEEGIRRTIEWQRQFVLKNNKANLMK